VTREQLAHLLRLAASVADNEEVIVVDSQPILGSYDDNELREPAHASIEADVSFTNDPVVTKRTRSTAPCAKTPRLTRWDAWQNRTCAPPQSLGCMEKRDRLVHGRYARLRLANAASGMSDRRQ
jgi:hypothetical protein